MAKARSDLAMAVKTVNLPVVWTMNREMAMMAQHSGQMEAIQARRAEEANEAAAELNEALQTGFVVIASNVIEASERTFVSFTLWKHDGDDWAEQELDKLARWEAGNAAQRAEEIAQHNDQFPDASTLPNHLGPLED
jgi:hypothetical protein